MGAGLEARDTADSEVCATRQAEGFIVKIVHDGGNKSQNVTECNGGCNGSKMRKCLRLNMCNGVTAFSEQWSGADLA